MISNYNEYKNKKVKQRDDVIVICRDSRERLLLGDSFHNVSLKTQRIE